MYKITKNFSFEAAHRLMCHKGKCHNLHGHSYKVSVSVARNDVDAGTGMVMDFSDLKKIVKDNIIDIFDHATILNAADEITIKFVVSMNWNLVVMQTEPTAENMARRFKKAVEKELKKLGHTFSFVSVSVWETANSRAEA